MALNSIVTNVGAQIALQSLNKTNDALAVTQKRISTGMRVADSRDDGAAFAVAERVRGEVAATTSANEQLGAAKGLLDVTRTSLENVSTSLVKLKELTVKLADGAITTEQRTQYQAQAKELTNNIKSFITDADYNGSNLVNTGGTTVKIVTNSKGDNYSVAAYDAIANIFDNVSGTNTFTQGDAAAALTTSGKLGTAITNTLTQLNNFGSYTNYVTTQVDFNKKKVDALESGVGALVDADLAKESAKLQSLQIRQQLGTQALGIANQAPQSLLSLFR
jgi:flagellin